MAAGVGAGGPEPGVSTCQDLRLAAWWRGPCLTAAIDAFAPAGRAAAGWLFSASLV